MTRIDFYVLKDVELHAMQRLACHLAGKALAAGRPTVILSTDEDSARLIDELLWDYPDQRFLPHGLQHTAAAKGAPIVLCWDEPDSFDGVLVNLSSAVPDFFTRFERVVEIVVGATRDPGRARYKHYRDRGFPLYHHDLDDWEAA